MLTGVRTLVAALRKSELCKCGCKGWDSVYQILLMLAWSFEALAVGKHPQTRHDGSPWGEDVGRSSLSGAELGFKVALVLVKCDLAELSPSFGFPGVTSNIHPCLYCWETAEGWRNLRCLSSLGNGRQKTLEDLTHACERCETLIIVADENFPKLRAALKPDRREQGKLGLCVVIDVPELGLMKGDRLEPTPQMPIIMNVYTKTRPRAALSGEGRPKRCVAVEALFYEVR